MSVAPTSRQTQVIALALIDPPELDARVERPDDFIEELARDILKRGLIQPIFVFVKGERFEAVDGYTRIRAHERAGLDVIECFVFPARTLALEGVKYASNIFRLEPTAADEAKMFFELFHNECGEDIERVAALTGKTIAYVNSRLLLAMGDDLIFEAVKRKQISLGVAEQLNKIDKPDWRRYYLELAARDGITVAIAVKWLADYRTNHADRPSSAAATPATSAPIVPVSSYDPLRCHVCREVTDELPEMISVHPSCNRAVLRKLIDAYHGGPSPS